MKPILLPLLGLGVLTVSCTSSPPAQTEVGERLARTTSALTAAGSEQCDTLDGASFQSIVDQLASAKALAAADARVHPGGQTQAAADAIDEAIQTIDAFVAWMNANNLDGTNPTTAINFLTQTNAALGSVLTAAQATASAAPKSSDANDAFEALARVIPALHDLGADGGRCDMDKNASWWDWRGGVAPETAAASPPPVPTSCADLGRAALDPFDALLSSVISHEQAGIAANAGQDYGDYSRHDIDAARAASEVISTLRASLAEGNLTAADAATASSIQSALTEVANHLVAGDQQALYAQAYFQGQARYAFEADVAAGDYALRLALTAGRCIATPAAGPAKLEMASIAVPVGTTCSLHPAGDFDPNQAVHVTADEDGVVRFQAVRPATPNGVERLALDCVDSAGAASTYTVDLRSPETFTPRPFEASRTTLEARPALAGDPLAVTQGELVQQGYGVRPDPTANPDGYARWLQAASMPAYKLRSAVGPSSALLAARSSARPVSPFTTSERVGSRVESFARPSPTRSVPPFVAKELAGIDLGAGLALGGVHVDSITRTTTPNWTGALLTGSYAVNANAALTQSYIMNEATFTVPTITPGGYGTGATAISIWNGIDANPNLLQPVVIIHSTSTTTSFSIHRQGFAPHSWNADQTDDYAGTRFTPESGDELFLQEWYCDAKGAMNLAGGYACTYMADKTKRVVWSCTQADGSGGSNCPSYHLDPGDLTNGNLGRVAEFVIENERGNAAWMDFSQVTMSGSALVVRGNDPDLPGKSWVVTTSTDPRVVLDDDFTSNVATHVDVALSGGSSVTWTVGTALVTGMTPTKGPNGGGAVVTITGEGFDTSGQTVVTFGGRPVSVVCNSSTQCQATAPPLAGMSTDMTVDVVVTVNGRPAGAASDYEFTYLAGPSCSTSYSCDGLEGGPPNATITCDQTVDFRRNGALVSTGTATFTERTSFGLNDVSACAPGSTASCALTSTGGGSPCPGAPPPLPRPRNGKCDPGCNLVENSVTGDSGCLCQ